MFLSGDRHLTELTKMPRLGMYALYDATISPLTSKPFAEPEEPNPWRVPGTWTTVRNFALLEVTGPRADRVLTITVRDQNAKILWKHPIHQRELRNGGAR
jgi:alkaline phosphatase D